MKLIISGDTRPAKETLKKAGWTWDSAAKVWWMDLVAAHADRVRQGDTEFSHKSLKINRKGCQVTLDGVVVWTSKTFGVAAETHAGDSYNPAGDSYNHDAFGNFVAAQKIPGSSPDDRI